MGDGRNRVFRFLAPLLIIAAGVVAYANSLHGMFIFDDRAAISENPRIKHIWPLTTSLRTNPRTPVSARPVVQFSFAINYAAGGFNTFGYHVWNLCVHICCGLLIYGICRRLLQHDGAALASALIFIVHPLNSECVDYIMQRSESMMAMFALLTAYCFIRRWYVPAVIACALGMGCKEPMAAVPVLVLAMDRIFITRSWRGINWKAHFAIFSTLLVLAYLQSGNPHGEVFVKQPGLNSWTYLITETGVIAHYLKLVFWPNPLALDYFGWPLEKHLGYVWPYAILEIGLVVATIVALKRWPKAGFVGLCFFLILAPSSSILPLAGEFASERRMYLPMAAIVPLLVYGAFYWLRAVPTAIKVAIVVLAIGPMTYACITRNQQYRNDETIWRDTVEKRPGNARAWGNLAAIYERDNRPADAMYAAERAVTLDPGLTRAHRVLGIALSKKGEHEEALLHLRAAIEGPDDALTRREIGLAYARSGDDRSALNWLRASERIKPDVVTENEYGFALAREGHIDEAMQEFNAAIAKDPKLADAHYNLGVLLAMRGDVKGAMNELRETIKLNAKRYDAMIRFAWIVATTPDASGADVSQAIDFAKRACDADPRNAEWLDTYAAVLARAGDFKEAIAIADHAKEFATRSGNARLALAIERREDRYRHSQAYSNLPTSRGSSKDK